MSKCENCQKYADCASGSSLTWPYGAYVPRAQAPEQIHTYPEMNETIKDLLRRSEEPMNQYILNRGKAELCISVLPELRTSAGSRGADRIAESEVRRMDDVFTIQARRCKRCGRLLVSRDGIKFGYGCQCMRKAKEEELARQPLEGQANLFDYITESEEKNDAENQD